MTAIERTAYPRFKRRPSAQELADVYTPTADELTFILVANAVAIQNVIDLTRAVRSLLQEGYPVRREDLAALSPY